MSDEDTGAGANDDAAAGANDDAAADDAAATDDDADAPTNDGQRFDRLPATDAEREVAGRATREEVLDWWDERFGIGRETLGEYTFWEKGAGKVWVFNGEADDPSRVEAIGLSFLRTRQEHWKPTTRAIQRFGGLATRNVVELDAEQAARFAAGEDQDLPEWDGDWGYLAVTHELAGETAPMGVGLYLYDELRSVVPKGSREELAVVARDE